MPYPKFYFSNVLDAADLTVSSEDTEYPKENLQDRDKNTKTKPGANGTYTITADAGEDTTASALIIVNNNLYTQGVTGIYAQIDDNPSFSSPTNIVGSPGSPVAPAAADEPNWFELFSGVSPEKTERYWRLVVLGATTDCEIGDIYFAKRIDLERYPGGPWEYGSEEQGSVTTGRGFVSAINWGESLDAVTLELLAIPKATADEIWAAQKTIVRSRWLPWFYHDEYGNLNHVRLNGRMRKRHHSHNLYDMSIPIKVEP